MVADLVDDGRPLSPDVLKAHILAELDAHPAITSRTTGALVGAVNRDHVQIAVATRVEDMITAARIGNWTIELQNTYPWSADRRVEITVRTTW